MFKVSAIVATVGLLATTACLGLVATQPKTCDQDQRQANDETQSYYKGEGYVKCAESGVTIMTEKVGVFLEDDGALYAATEPEEVDPWGEEWIGELTLEVKDGLLSVEVVSIDGQCTSFTFELEDKDTALEDLYAGDPNPVPSDLALGATLSEEYPGGSCNCEYGGCSCSACCAASQGPAECTCRESGCLCKCLKQKKISSLIEYSIPVVAPNP